ncbi:MAG: T9SS type A sorting domain-containing protein [Saprospiraceae bacterium]
MRPNILSCSALFICLLSAFPHLKANNSFLVDPCDGNDVCQTAKLFPNVSSDQSYTCIDECNLNAAPDPIVSACQMGDFPTVWYEVDVDADASVINIEVRTSDFESPVISLFEGNAGCDNLDQVNLTNGNLSCIIGDHGVAMAVGTTILPSSRYYIAVSSLNSIGGNFKICISTISKGSFCVANRDLQVTARSNGGPLEGPFDPGEKVSICMNVNEYTAAANGCQWFQGIVPVFGNGWDPSSFDSIGQPYNAFVNGLPFGLAGNGDYGASNWAWFQNVGYHHDNSRLQIGDFDNNGRLDICNGAYEIDCPSQGGITGGCCGPCWDDEGDLLPPGWFAYGINGTCPTLGPPIKVDWGDGNTCGGGMGPWRFCFDLVTRNTPDCLGDSTRHDLTLGYYTFADGEIGSWTGGPSACAYDQPIKMILKALCGKVLRRKPEILPDLCSGDVFQFQIGEDNISTWEWNISPARALPLPAYTGENGYVIKGRVKALQDKPVAVTGIFIGHVSGTNDLVIKKIYFNIIPCGLNVDILPYEGNDKLTYGDVSFPLDPVYGGLITKRSVSNSDLSLKVYPTPSSDKITVEWFSPIHNDAVIRLLNADGKILKSVPVLQNDSTMKVIDIKDIEPGVYFVSMSNSGINYVGRVVKI